MLLPRYLSQHDVAVLTQLIATGWKGARPSGLAGRRLAALLGSTTIVPEPGAGPRHVGLGATVRYRSEGERETSAVVIACPDDASALLARVPVLAPVALGLLGHAEGRTVGIDLPHGRTQWLDIVEVQPPCTCRSLVSWPEGGSDAPN